MPESGEISAAAFLDFAAFCASAMRVYICAFLFAGSIASAAFHSASASSVCPSASSVTPSSTRAGTNFGFTVHAVA
jgi:hypothetical protein